MGTSSQCDASYYGGTIAPVTVGHQFLLRVESVQSEQEGQFQAGESTVMEDRLGELAGMGDVAATSP